jgi:pheromone shutdown protein TraB
MVPSANPVIPGRATNREGRAMKKMVFFAISVVTVMLMYLVPFFVLSGTVGPQTLIFWTLTALAYLVIASIFMRGDR